MSDDDDPIASTTESRSESLGLLDELLADQLSSRYRPTPPPGQSRYLGSRPGTPGSRSVCSSSVSNNTNMRRRDIFFTAYVRPWYLTDPDSMDPRIKFVRVQAEICPTTAKLHWQGYMQFKPEHETNAQGRPTQFRGFTYSVIKKIMRDETVHLEPRKSEDVRKTIEYCSKKETKATGDDAESLCFGAADMGLSLDADIQAMHRKRDDSKRQRMGSHGGGFTAGRPTRQGERTDIRTLADSIKSGRFKSISDIAVSEYAHMLAKYPSGVKLLVQEMQSASAPDWRNVHVEVHYGDTGTGKTLGCRIAAEGRPVYILQPPEQNQPLWWCDYNAEEVLVIDEFTGWLSPQTILRLIDGHPVNLQVKGTSPKKARWTTVYFTSNMAPHHANWWFAAPNPAHRCTVDIKVWEAIWRRLTNGGKTAPFKYVNTEPDTGASAITMDSSVTVNRARKDVDLLIEVFNMGRQSDPRRAIVDQDDQDSLSSTSGLDRWTGPLVDATPESSRGGAPGGPPRAEKPPVQVSPNELYTPPDVLGDDDYCTDASAESAKRVGPKNGPTVQKLPKNIEGGVILVAPPPLSEPAPRRLLVVDFSDDEPFDDRAVPMVFNQQDAYRLWDVHPSLGD